MKTTLLTTLALAFCACAFADDKMGANAKKSGANTSAEFQNSFAGTFDYTNDHILQLAQALSAEQYDWQPAEGVRTTREVILHIAGANYMLGSQLGKSMPDGIAPQQLESTVTDRDKVISTLEDSIAFARAAVLDVSESEWPTQVKLFGMDMSKMTVAFVISGHAHEHLGQLIAYARSVGVAPPWSE